MIADPSDGRSEPDSLSEEERARATALVERDERKKAKKAELKSAKGQRHHILSTSTRSLRPATLGGGREGMPVVEIFGTTGVLSSVKGRGR